MVVIFRAVEHDDRAFKGVEIVGVREIAVAEFLVDHRQLHDGAGEEVAAQHREAGASADRCFEGLDDFAVLDGGVLAVLADALAVGGDGVFLDQLLVHQLLDHGGHAAGMVEILAQIFARRHHVHQQGNVAAILFPFIDLQIDADMAGDGIEMDRRVGRTADGAVDANGVDKGVLGENVRRLAVGLHHFHDLQAGAVGRLVAVAIGGRYRGRARQRHAQRLGQRVHGTGGAHGVAEADRRRRRGDQLDEALIVDLACGQQLARDPHDGARTGAFALVPAIQHGADRQRDRRDVHRRRRHQGGRGGLVAADGQDAAIERIAVHQLDQAEVRQVAVQAGGGALAGFLDGMAVEFQRDAARLADAFAHALGQHDVMPVAGRQVAAALGDADDRLARLQFLQRQAEGHVAFQVERGHVGIVGIVEPGARAQLAVGFLGHGMSFPAGTLMILSMRMMA